MSTPIVLPRHRRPPPHRALVPQVAVWVALLMWRMPPARIARILSVLRRRARPATMAEAARARGDVLSVSRRCNGQGCLPRSIATAVLCRLRGHWPSWCTGVTISPFNAHAWVEVDGEYVNEPYPAGYYQKMIEITPEGARCR